MILCLFVAWTACAMALGMLIGRAIDEADRREAEALAAAARRHPCSLPAPDAFEDALLIVRRAEHRIRIEQRQAER